MAVDKNVKLWAQANQIYAELIDLPVSEAVSKLHTLENVGAEVKELVITLINSGDQSSQYFKDHIISQYHKENETRLIWKAGQHIDNYELLEKIGEGGMSQVFSAKRLDSKVQKPVAVKIFTPHEGSATLLEHFLSEQRILSDLSHRHVVNMHHGGTTEEGISYIVMELVDGAVPVDEYVLQEKASLKDKVKLVADAASAIAYAHGNLIIHRDIKPSNLIVGKDGMIKVVDFGIAKLISKNVEHDTTTIMALTPSFASPEQINSSKITVASDVFSLAAVCLTLLTGKNPLPKDRLIKSCVDDEAFIWKSLKSDVKDKDLKNILNKSLQQEPNKRYNSMYKFAEDLHAWLNDKPISATPDSWLYRLSKFAKRRSALFAALTTLFVTLGLAVVVLSWQYNKIKIEAQKALEVKSFMLDVFSYADPDQNIGKKLTALDLLSLAEDEIQFKTFQDNQVKADILSSIGIAFANIGGWEEGERNLLESLKLDPDNIVSLLKLAELHMNNSKPEQAEELLGSIAELLKEQNDDYAYEKAEFLLLQALHSTFNNEDTGIEKAGAALKAYQDLGDFPGVLKSTRVYAEKLDSLSRTDEAIEASESSIVQLKDKISPVNTEMMRLKTTLVYLHGRNGAYQDAKDDIDEIVANIREKLGNKHPALIDALVQSSLVHKELGQMPEAMAAATESFEVSQILFGENSQMAQQGLSMLAQLKFSQGDRAEALEDLLRVVAMSKNNYGEENRITLEAQTELSNYLAANGKVDEAIEMASSTNQKYRQLFGSAHRQTIFSTNILLKLYATQEVGPEKILMAENNNKNALEQLGIKHPQTAFSFFVLGNIYSQGGKLEEANQAYIALLDNDLVGQNNPRFVALALAISENYSKLDKSDSAIEYASKAYHSAQSIFGKTAMRSLQSRLALMGLLKDSDNKAYQQHLFEVEAMIADGSIDNKQFIEIFKTYSVEQ